MCYPHRAPPNYRVRNPGNALLDWSRGSNPALPANVSAVRYGLNKLKNEVSNFTPTWDSKYSDQNRLIQNIEDMKKKKFKCLRCGYEFEVVVFESEEEKKRVVTQKP